MQQSRSITCTDCAAVCCRLEVLCITETGVPERYLQENDNSVPTMRRLDDGWCAALDRVNMCCGIYEQRPLICREFGMGGPDCIAERASFSSISLAGDETVQVVKAWPV